MLSRAACMHFGGYDASNLSGGTLMQHKPEFQLRIELGL